MPLIPGARLGPYEIVATVGAGGMGEVYRARDARLQRDVAIKVLPEGFALDPDRLARFQREAQVLASLNHPHIAHVYRLEDDPVDVSPGAAAASGIPSARIPTCALVMELVEGPTLAERLKGGAIPIDEALTIARQIADALEAAHERGIVHRDLKPANIKLTPDGAVKVLDFGLAKALDSVFPERGWELSPSAIANSPTMTSPAATLRGVILGTAAYMSPEQARGKLVDKRADIWAFGVVLYEMLTGRRLFSGQTVSDVLAEVLKTEPDWKALPPETPSRVSRLLVRCLQRDPRQRLRDIGDARIELDEIDAPRPEGRSSFGRLRAITMLAAGTAIALLGATASSWLRPSATTEAAAPVRFLITPSDGVALDDPPIFAVSPDGRHILLRGSESGITYWYVRAIASREVRRLNSTRSAGAAASWSADSRSIDFYKTGAFYRVAIDDTRLQTLGAGRASVSQGSSSSSRNGDLVFIEGSRVMAVSEGGGSPRVVLELDGNTRGWGVPWMMPDGRRFLLQNAGSAAGNILLATLNGAEAPRFLEHGTQAAYAAPGWLLAIRNRQLLAWKFDAERGSLGRDPVVVIGDVGLRAHLGGRSFSVSQTGVLAIRNDVPTPTRVVWFDRAGVEGAPLKLDRHCRNPEIAPDGTRAALECYDEGNARDVWIYDFARDAASRFTVDPADDANALWSPDGRSIIFDSNRRGSIFRKSSSGTSQEEVVLETPENTHAMAWSPDGRYIAVTAPGVGLATLDLAKGRTLVPAVGGSFQQLELQFSPDGRFFSYSSDESGRAEIYVQPWPPNGDRWQISNDGATDARWRPDAKEVFFLAPDRRLMAVPIDTSGGFHAGTPTRLFQTRIAGPLGSGQRFPYAVSRDGKRFLMYVSDIRAAPPSIDVIVNWPSLMLNK
jgi:Tol biopolymer transport system component